MKKNQYILISSILLIFLLAACSPIATNEDNKEIKIDNTYTTTLAESNSIVNVKDGELITITAKKIKKIIDGKEIEMYAYNGLVPGVALRVEQDSTIRVKFINELDEETTVHWHGLRHDINNDGVPDISQDPVLPGESFIYELYFPDAGVFWYHPHIREDRQQELGLAGNMLVDPTASNYYNQVNKEELLVLDDILLDDNGVVPFGEEHANYVLMGRFGNVMLVNGEENYNLNANKGDVIRFYISNVANTRTFNFSIEGALLKLVGGELSKFEKEEMIDSIVIAPAQRYIVEAYFPNEGKYALKHINPYNEYNLGTISVSSEASRSNFVSEFSVLRTNNDVVEDIKKFDAYQNSNPDYEITLTMDLAENMHAMMNEMMADMMDDESMMNDENIMMDEEEEMMKNDMPGNNMMGGKSMMRDTSGMINDDYEDTMMNDDNMMNYEEEHEGIEWEDVMVMMNKRIDSSQLTWILQNKDSKKENMNWSLNAKVGDVIKVRLFNDPGSMHPMQHPIHLHGQRFIVTSIDGEPVENQAWTDTVLVPMGSTIDIVIDVTNPGEWMMHCHIAEHLEAGMMTSLIVEES